MNIVGRARAGRAFFSVACFLAFAGLGRAEVGFSRHLEPGPSALYIVQIIVDDPDPIGTAWKAYNTPNDHLSILNPEGFANGDGRPSLLRSVFSGLPMVAWAKNSPNGYDVVLSSFANGVWTTPSPLAITAADELDPSLIMDPADGTVHLVWWVNDGSPRVMHRQAPADLSSWSPAEQLSQPGEIACRPSGTFHEGVLRVVYEVHDLGHGTSPRQIVLASQSGTTFTSSMLAMTLYEAPNWPEVHSAGGELWVEWLDTTDEVTWVEQQPAGSWTPVEIEPYGSAEDRDFHVRGRVRHLALQ